MKITLTIEEKTYEGDLTEVVATAPAPEADTTVAPEVESAPAEVAEPEVNA